MPTPIADASAIHPELLFRHKSVLFDADNDCPRSPDTHRDPNVTETWPFGIEFHKLMDDPKNVVTAAKQLKNGDTIDVEGDHLVVFHFCEAYGQVVVDAVSSVSARRFELHYAPDTRISVL